MSKRIFAFGEDEAHRRVIDALIVRVAAELNVNVTVHWRTAWRGHGQVVHEFKRYLRHVDMQGEWPDFIVVATDANCKGLLERSRQIPIENSQVPVILAIPDPHIERWLLLDSSAFKKVFGKGCQAPIQKCERNLYKHELVQAIIETGITPNFGGIEFAADIVKAMDLKQTYQDESLKRFIEDLRRNLRHTLKR